MLSFLLCGIQLTMGNAHSATRDQSTEWLTRSAFREKVEGLRGKWSGSECTSEKQEKKAHAHYLCFHQVKLLISSHLGLFLCSAPGISTCLQHAALFFTYVLQVLFMESIHHPSDR